MPTKYGCSALKPWVADVIGGTTMDCDKAENDKGTEVSATTRRAILLGGAAGLAGLVAGSVISAEPASAAEGGNVLIGEDNSGATARTAVFYTGNTAVGVLADGANSVGVQGQDNSSGGHGIGVYGQSINGTGVYGSGSTYGVYGSGSTHGVGGFGTTYGVYGFGTTYGVYGAGDTYGVFGYSGNASSIAVAASLMNPANPSPAVQAQTAGTGSAVEATIDNTANSSPAVSGTTNGSGGIGVLGSGLIGVQGSGTATGVFGSGETGVAGSGAKYGVSGNSANAAGAGVLGQATNGAIGVEGASDTGEGVLAKSTSGDALKVVGKVAFSRSGLATVAATKKSVTVNLAGVTTSSMVIATLQTAAGAIGVANAVPATGKFTINLMAAPTGAVKVAWFIIG